MKILVEHHEIRFKDTCVTSPPKITQFLNAILKSPDFQAYNIVVDEQHFLRETETESVVQTLKGLQLSEPIEDIENHNSFVLRNTETGRLYYVERESRRVGSGIDGAEHYSGKLDITRLVAEPALFSIQSHLYGMIIPVELIDAKYHYGYNHDKIRGLEQNKKGCILNQGEPDDLFTKVTEYVGSGD